MSKQQGTAPPPGVFVPVPTFFKSTDSSSASSSVDYSKYKAAAVGRPALDLEAQSKHTLFLASNGIHGITYLGSTGEANHLNRAERRQLISSQRKTLDEAGFTNYPIMAGALTQSTEDAIEQLHDAAESGAQWSLVLAPGYFASVVNQESLRAWFLEVAEASPIPILIYHYPGVSNNIVVTTETYELLSAHPNIVGAKLSHGDLSQFLQIANSPRVDRQKFSMYSGFGQLLLPVMLLGSRDPKNPSTTVSCGVIDGLAGIFPAAVVRLYNLSTVLPLTAEAIGEALKLQVTVSAAEELLGSKWGGIVGIKDAIHRYAGMGNLSGGRNPIAGNMGEEGWNVYDERFRAMAEIEKSLK